MARKKSKAKKHEKRRWGRRREEEEEDEEQHSWHSDILPETKKGILAVFLLIAAALLILSYLGKGGTVGSYAYHGLDLLMGKGFFFMPLIFVVGAISLLKSEKRNILGATIFGSLLFLIAVLSSLNILFGDASGGFLGAIISTPLLTLFDFWASLIIILGLIVISLLLVLNIPLWRRQTVHLDENEKENEEEDTEEELEKSGRMKNVLAHINSAVNSAVQKAAGSDQNEEPKLKTNIINGEEEEEDDEDESPEEEQLMPVRKIAQSFSYKKPPLDLLQGDRGKPSSGDIRANANIIKRTFENFNIDVDMEEVSIGPTVTQYTLKPAEGVKLSRITALHNNLSLALAAHPIRIEAPIPGRSLVGIEVPNKSVMQVGLRALLEDETYQDSTSPLLLALGRDVTGTTVYTDLARMPHLLIGGVTGSGKSVAVHSILASLLYRNPPEMLRLIIIDPKRVELSSYNDIPHLLSPVITEPKKAIQSLRWAAKEMDRRYELLLRKGSRDIISYNSAVANSKDETRLPYIVVIIDELAELMQVYPRELESGIVRLAQLARAVGIHLVVSTQRPSVEVITGLIKANIATRIAFNVPSQIDSRTILDMPGAEKLLGNGDMLYLSGDSSKPRRIQGAFISEQEVKRVVEFLKEGAEIPEYDEAIIDAKADEDGDSTGSANTDDEPLYEDAQALVLETQKASASFLQRRLRVGYARAARLLDMMEENGIIGPQDGAKPRDILVGSGQEKDELEINEN